MARLNIEYFRKKLVTETDEAKRQMILRLLAEEEAKVAAPPARPDQRIHQRH